MGKANATSFKPGTSGNPGGLPTWVREVRQLAGQHSLHAIERLAELLDHEDPRVVIAAAEALLDRAGATPLKVVTLTVADQAARPLAHLSDEELRAGLGPKGELQA